MTLHRTRRRAGLTLIELLVALALTGIVLIPAAALLLQAFTSETAYRQQNSAQQNARHAVDVVADDVKGAKRLSTVVTVGTVLATMPTSTVRGAGVGSTAVTPTSAAPLYFNIYDDGTNPPGERRVRYWLEGTNLRRDIEAFVNETTTLATPASATSGVVVARNVLLFTAQKPLLTANDLDPSHYNTVRIIVRATGDGTAGNGSSVTVQSDVTLRNNLL
ncbi:MAG: prepilin-type N-terminal cleavage/methylation domain-containing protein [Armatimonadota bacterium]